MSPAAPTFADLAAEIIANAERAGRAPNTLRGYRATLRRHLLPRFGERPIDELAPEDLSELIAALRERGLTENGIVDILKPLRRALDLALRRGLIETDPFDALDPASRPQPARDEHRILTPDEIGALAGAADEPTGVAIGLALFCGLRSSEARALTVGDFDPDGPAIRVASRRVDGLGDAFGFLGSLGARLDALDLGPDDHLVRSPTGRHFDRGNFSRRYTSAVARAGLAEPGGRPLTFEQLRNNFAALGARIGADPIELLRQLGKTHTASLQAHLPDFDRPPLSRHQRERLRVTAGHLASGSPFPERP